MGSEHKTPEELCKELGIEYNQAQQDFIRELGKQLILCTDKSNTHWTLVNLNILRYLKGK